jgi:hypothetical protein
VAIAMMMITPITYPPSSTCLRLPDPKTVHHILVVKEASQVGLKPEGLGGHFRFKDSFDGRLIKYKGK